MRDWAIVTALDASKVEGTTRFALALVAGHWSNGARVSYPGIRRIAELSACAPSTAGRRLAALVASGDLVVVERGRGKRATRYAIPALDDAVAREGLAFASEGTLRPFVSRPSGDANALDPFDEPLASRADPVASRIRPALRGTEVGSNEVPPRARAREDVESYVATDEERARVAPTIQTIRRSLGMT